MSWQSNLYSYSTESPSELLNVFQLCVEDVIISFVQYGLRLVPTSGVSTSLGDLLNTSPAGVSFNLVFYVFLGICLTLILWFLGIKWILSGSYRYRLRVNALTERQILKKRHIYNAAIITIVFSILIFISVLSLVYFLTTILIWAYQDYPKGIENMFRDINSLGLNSVSDLDDGTIGSFEDMKNRVHDIMVDYFESKTPVDGIKNNQNMSNLIAMAEFISDVSKSYVNKVYPYVEEGLIMTPRIGDTSKHLEKLKEVNFLNNSWCQDKVKCTEVRELISQASNLESLWPSQSMLESLTERPNESINILSKNFAKMSHVASRINETFKNFGEHLTSLTGVRINASNGIDGIRESLGAIKMDKKPDSLERFGTYMKVLAISFFSIILSATVIFILAPLVLFIISTFFVACYPLGVWQSQKAIKIMSIGMTILLIGSFILSPIMLLTIYGGAKVDMYACEIMRQPKYEKSMYKQFNIYFNALMKDTFVNAKLANVKWDLAREMRLCRKGEPLYKVLHLKLIEDISLRGETVRYSSVAENTLNEFLALISEKLQVSMKYFDPQYDIQLNNFNGTMKTLDDSIKLNKNFEERWSKELSTPLDRAEEILKEIRRKNSSSEIDKIIYDVRSILAFKYEIMTFQKRGQTLRNFLHTHHKGEEYSIFEAVKMIKNLSLGLKKAFELKGNLSTKGNKDVIDQIASEIRFYDEQVKSSTIKKTTCQPIYTIYNHLRHDACYQLGYSINGITAGIGLALLSYIPIIIVLHFLHCPPPGPSLLREAEEQRIYRPEGGIKMSTPDRDTLGVIPNLETSNRDTLGINPHMETSNRDPKEEFYQKDPQFLDDLKLVLRLQGARPLPPSPTSNS